MNDRRRSALRKAIDELRSAVTKVSDAASDEDMALSNMPENLEGSDRYEAMENAVDLLNDATEDIESAIDKIEEAIL